MKHAFTPHFGEGGAWAPDLPGSACLYLAALINGHHLPNESRLVMHPNCPGFQFQSLELRDIHVIGREAESLITNVTGNRTHAKDIDGTAPISAPLRAS